MGPNVLVLGAVEARGAAGPIAVSGAKLQALLAMLALAVPNPVSDDRLIEELWGDDQPANPANSLQAQVSQLRRVLGREVVARRGPGYALRMDPLDVDAGHLDALVAQARAAAADGDHRGAAQRYRAALALVRGPILANLADHDFAREAAARLDELLLTVQEGLGDAELAAGRHAEVVGALGELARAHPLRERFAAQLITALYRSGRQVDALRAYADVREALIEEFGVEPGPELRHLEAAVLAQDEALAGPLAAATAAAASAIEPTGDAFHETPGRLAMVGRDGELAGLRGDLDDALVGRGRIAVLVGEPGIGKTRLAEELAREALAHGAVIGWGRCHDEGGAGAFWPWVQVLRTIIERAPRDEVVAALGRGAAVLAQVAPDVHDLVDGLQEPPPLDLEGARFRVHDALTTFLRRLARTQPVMITIDDIQWADPPSLQLLSFLAREITDARLLVLVTYRSVGTPADSDLARALAHVVRQPIARRVDLTGLDREALAALVEAVGGVQGDDVVTTVHRRTQGNPFFALEVLRLLPERDELAGADPAALRDAVPSGVRDVIRQRLRALPPDTMDLLGTAAVIGRDFDAATLAATTRTAGEDVLARLQGALDAGIVMTDPLTGDHQFSHGLVNETIYGDLSEVDRARQHHQLAEALEARHGDAAGPHLLEVASHRARAVPVGAPDRAIAAAAAAARWAEAHLDHDQAEAQLQTALALLADLPAGRPRDLLELGVLEQLSALRVHTIGYASGEVMRVCLRMRDLCQGIEGSELLVPALWRLSIYFCIAMELDTALELADQLLAIAGPHEDPAPTLAGHLAIGTILTHRGDIAEARVHLDVATELMAAGHGDTLVASAVAETPWVWLDAFSSWNWWLLGDEARAEELALAGVAAGEARGSVYGTMFATWFSVLLATLQRDPEAVLERCERGLPLATTSGFGMFVPYMLVCRGWAVAVQGELEIGGDELLGAAAAIKASGARMMVPVFPAFHADACLTAGRPAAALVRADDGLAELEVTGERWYEAELLRLRAEALAALEPTSQDAVDSARRAVEVATAQGAEGLVRRAAATLQRLTGSAPGAATIDAPTGQPSGTIS
ncbi:MAG TPA: BTAD domain-containing putative transcriptional regulator [Aquihabitans sp.]|jgi:DNA-binding SARP family transcriptional activator|nr:BTAD domain-containing putative transcriptional regulator [Aquihabitans sp.]